MAGKVGKRHRVTDAELIALLKEHGTIVATAKAAGYYDKVWVSRRLRKAGVPPGKPGRPKRGLQPV